MEINNTFQNRSPFSLDQEYTKKAGNTCVPYSSTAEVNSLIVPQYRSIGRFFIVATSNGNRPYWYQGGIQDSDLVPVDLTISAGTNISITHVGNVISISASAISVGDSSTQETFTVTGDFTKAFPSGTIITSFILDPPDTNSYTISVGTTPGGGDIFNAVTVDGTNPPSFEYLKYFKNFQTWYFTGVPSGTLVVIMYRPQILLT